MKPKTIGLLIHDSDDRFLTLQFVLDGLGVETRRARTLKQAASLLCETPPPHVVLTDTVLSDGNWMDVLDLAAKAKEKVNVIVVSPVEEISLHLDTMQQGAFDFVTHSFTVPGIVHVLRSAIENAHRARRNPPELPAPSRPTGRSRQTTPR
jgi:DNA-binding NtrC family response regulator